MRSQGCQRRASFKVVPALACAPQLSGVSDGGQSRGSLMAGTYAPPCYWMRKLRNSSAMSAWIASRPGKPLEVPFRPSVLNGKVLALNPAQLTQPVPERITTWCGFRGSSRRSLKEKAYPVDLPCWLRLDAERHKSLVENQNDHEPDPAHSAPRWGGLAGSLADLNYWRLTLSNASQATRCVACHGVGSHPVPVALVGECSIPVV